MVERTEKLEPLSFTDEERVKPNMVFDLRIRNKDGHDTIYKGIVLSSFAMTRIEAFIKHKSIAAIDGVGHVSHIGFCSNIMYFAGYDGNRPPFKDEEKYIVEWFLTLHVEEKQ